MRIAAAMSAVSADAYGPELVTNGTFDSDSDWVKQSPWAITSGVASYVNSVTGPRIASAVDMQIGKTYELRFTFGGPSVGIRLQNAPEATNDTGAENIDFYSAAGDFVVTYTPTIDSGNYLSFRTWFGDLNMTIDNVSVREVL
jgi:hypothetical protein